MLYASLQSGQGLVKYSLQMQKLIIVLASMVCLGIPLVYIVKLKLAPLPKHVEHKSFCKLLAEACRGLLYVQAVCMKATCANEAQQHQAEAQRSQQAQQHLSQQVKALTAQLASVTEDRYELQVLSSYALFESLQCTTSMTLNCI